MERIREKLGWRGWILLAAVLVLSLIACVSLGSVKIPLKQIWYAAAGKPGSENIRKIIMNIRLPRVINTGLVGAGLSISGCAMQGLLRNPLADGSTLGVSSGASLGAVLAIALGVNIPGFRYGGTVIISMAFAFVSLIVIISMSYAMDKSLSTNSIILMGVIFSMFFSSLISLITSFSGEKIRTITFWTMGSLSGTGYAHGKILAGAVAIFGGIIISLSRELDAFALGEDNARHIGVNVKRVKLLIMASSSMLIGVCTAVAGSIGFVGLVVPHMVRMVTGPGHRCTLGVSAMAGAIFLMLCDLASRTIISPVELPIGVVTSLIGAVVFIFIFYRSGKAK